MSTFLWVIVPYICLAIFVIGHFWRYRYDKFGWTTRSSQLYETRLLRWGSPLFHFGMLGVVGGHIIGLLVPESWTDAIGITPEIYHVVAVAGGLIAGLMALVGMAILSVGGHYDYREGVSVWYRSFLAFSPKPELMAEAPLGFQLHALVAFGLFALWPFTRLVHVFSAPIGYLTRPYIVYRSKGTERANQGGNRAVQRGWEKANR